MSRSDSLLKYLTFTAELTAASRYRESLLAERLFDDPYALSLCSQAALDAMPESRSFNAMRTRYFDDAICALLAENKMTQIVVLGAGMDARPYRLEMPPCPNERGYCFFELDMSSVLEKKKAILGQPTRSEVFHIGLNFEEKTWPTNLTSHPTFDVTERTLWIAEGFFMYFDECEVAQLLNDVSALSAEGSYLVADFVNEQLYQREGYSARYLSGFDSPCELFEPRGWDCSCIEPGALPYRRDDILPLCKGEPGPRSFFVTTRKL